MSKIFEDGFFNNEFVTILIVIIAVCGLTYFDKEIPAIINMVIGVVGKGVYDKVKEK